MGLRSFVALPVDKGGAVIRLLAERDADSDSDRLIVNLAYGLSGKQTLLFGIPRQLSSGVNRTGDLSVLYRHIVVQNDRPASTSRLALFGGIVVPTQTDRSTRWQVGSVATFFRRRHELDLDVLWVDGGERDTARYDVSWQYRLIPTVYPQWGIKPEWWGVMELNGRWVEHEDLIHQLTLGLQWINSRWVLEGGGVRDLNGERNMRWLLSMRFHF